MYTQKYERFILWIKGKIDPTEDEIKSLTEFGLTEKIYNVDLNTSHLINFQKIVLLKGLQTLTITNTYLTSLPSEIGNLKELHKLDCSNNLLASLPSSVGNLSSLEFLKLSENYLTTLPIEIGNLSSLISLDLFQNKLKSLPSTIGNLPNLTKLILNYNQLTQIPSEIGKLSSLKNLYLDHNRLKFLPRSVGNLTNLKALFLDKNKLKHLPKTIGNLPSITYLSVQANNLKTVPSSIGNLKFLQGLDLSFNSLISIPPEIGNLTTLETLILCQNRLTEIPKEIGNIPTFQILDLQDNCLKTLPVELGICRIFMLGVSGNPLVHLPLNIHRLIERQKKHQGIYTDSQSVHNSSIQQSLKKSIIRMISVQVPTTSEVVVYSQILDDPVLSQFAKESLLEYAKDRSIHSELNLTFSDILQAVWNRICSSEHASEIKSVLNSEMQDAECKCFTGRISRLVNSLNGFDPLVEIKIADNEQIGNVIANVKAQLLNKNIYCIERHKEVALERLLELGYEKGIISEWLGYIE